MSVPSWLKPFFPSTKLQCIISLFGSALVLLISAVVLWRPLLSGQQIYPDIIASALTFSDTYKSGDIIYAFAITMLSLGSFFLFSALASWLFPHQKARATSKESENLLAATTLIAIQNSILSYFAFAALLSFATFILGPLRLEKSVQFILVLCSLALGIATVKSKSAWLKHFRLAIGFLLPLLLLRFLRLDVLPAGISPPLRANLLFQILGLGFSPGLSFCGTRACAKRL